MSERAPAAPLGSAAQGRPAVRLHDLYPASDTLRADVIRGLSAPERKLPPKYFYDATGAALFDRITELEAYYPTRTEAAILDRHIGDMASRIGPHARVVEFGSGSGAKTRILLGTLEEPATYIPVDISRAQLVAFATGLAADFPRLEVLPVCADYTRPFTLPPRLRPAARTAAFFPGSTLGNFERLEAAAFLRRIARLCGPGGALLIGIDLHKQRDVLERAYNDEQGVTAAFNLNLLLRINREIGTDFPLSAFRHHAFYDDVQRRIVMQLVCTAHCEVTVPAGQGGDAARFHFEPGDRITTEYSHKYTVEDFADLAQQTGWTVESSWTDDRHWFAVCLLRVSAPDDQKPSGFTSR